MNDSMLRYLQYNHLNTIIIDTMPKKTGVQLLVCEWCWPEIKGVYLYVFCYTHLTSSAVDENMIILQ